VASLSLDDGTLWYDETGEGPPLVFVHGGWTDADAWQAQVERFADEFRVITFDVRGHGRTGATDRARYTIDLFVDDLRRLLDHLDATRPILCGISLGSMVVQEFLSQHPGEARGAVLAGALRSMPPVELPLASKPFLSPLPALSLSLSTTGPRTTFRTMLGSIRAVTGGPWLALDPAVRARTMDAVGAFSRPEFLKVFDALYDFDPPELTDVTTPTLVVHGASEAPPVKRQSAQIADRLPNARLLSIADAAHLVNEDNPAAFDAACADLFDGLAADA
jgi:non-heme chloroperoxidase